MYQRSELIKNYTTSLKERIWEIKKRWIAASSKYTKSLKEFEEIHQGIYLLYTKDGLSLRKIAVEFDVDHTRIRQIVVSVKKKLSKRSSTVGNVQIASSKRAFFNSQEKKGGDEL